MQAREPIFNVPGVVQAVLAVMIAVHVGRQLMSPEDDLWLVYALAFIPARYAGLAAEIPGGEVAVWTSWVTHMFVHGDVVHLGLNAAWLLAFGGAIAPRIGAMRFLAFAAFCGIAGAATFLTVNPDSINPVIGASGAIAGLMGGTLRFLFSAFDQGGLQELSNPRRRVPLMTLRETLTDRRVLFASAALVAINVAMMLGLASDLSAGRIAWEAHLGGYFAGLFSFGLFDSDLKRSSNSQPNPD